MSIEEEIDRIKRDTIYVASKLSFLFAACILWKLDSDYITLSLLVSAFLLNIVSDVYVWLLRRKHRKLGENND